MSKLNLSKLREMDVVLTTDRGLWPMITRIVTGGWKNRHNIKIANHVGLVVYLNKQKAKRFSTIFNCKINPGLNIVEMAIPPRKSVWDAKCIAASFSKYKSVKFWKPRVLMIKRFSEYNNAKLRNIANDRTIDSVGKILYDFPELIEFVFNKFEDDQKKMICSRFVFEMTKNEVNWKEKYKDIISPYNIQKETNSNIIWSMK